MNAWINVLPPIAAIALLLLPFVIALAGILLFLYQAYRDMDVILAAFPNSAYVRNRHRLWSGNGVVSRFILISSLAAVALWPAGYIRRGELDPTELENLPPKIRTRLRVAWWLCVIGVGTVVILYAFL